MSPGTPQVRVDAAFLHPRTFYFPLALAAPLLLWHNYILLRREFVFQQPALIEISIQSIRRSEVSPKTIRDQCELYLHRS
jgi:hypothetical protein